MSRPSRLADAFRREILPVIGGIEVGKLRPGHVRALLAGMSQRGFAPATIAQVRGIAALSTPSLTDWIGTLSTLGLGVLGFTPEFLIRGGRNRSLTVSHAPCQPYYCPSAV